MPDILDGKYVGNLTRKEVVAQFKYRISIHETYAGLVVENPLRYPPHAYGDYDFQMWAINGYEWGIKYIRDSVQESVRKSTCVFSQILASSLNIVWMLCGKRTRFMAMVENERG